jgi:plastocyanin
MSREARSRVALGIGIPLAALVFLGALIFAFSRVLLAVPESLAPWVALLFAATILAGCALAATIQGTRGFAFLIGVLVLTIVGGGVAGAVIGERPVHSLIEEEPPGPPPGGEAGAPPPPEGSPPSEESPPPPPEESPGEPGGGGPAAGPVEITAQNTAFDTSQISLPPEQEVTISFTNQDAIPHNVSIYTEPGGDPIFQESPVGGPTTVEYAFTSPPPGEYYFQCDVHPQMNGTVSVG